LLRNECVLKQNESKSALKPRNLNFMIILTFLKQYLKCMNERYRLQLIQIFQQVSRLSNESEHRWQRAFMHINVFFIKKFSHKIN
jgi:hypothetical protein